MTTLESQTGDAPGSKRTLMIVFVAAGVPLVGGLIALVAYVLTPREFTASSRTVTDVDERIPVQVDSRLQSADAWHVSAPGADITSDRPNILAAKWGADVVQLLVFQADDTGADEVDMYIPLGRNLAPAEVVVRRKFQSTRPAVPATQVRGSISIDADELPSATRDRVVRYDITAQRDGHEQRFTGKVIVTAESLRSGPDSK